MTELTPGSECNLLLTAGAPYDQPDAGVGRRAVVFDSLSRELRRRKIACQLRVLFLEMDERLLTRSRIENRSPVEIADRGVSSWLEMTARLGVDPPDCVIRHQSLSQQVESILEELLRRRMAREERDGIRFLTGQDSQYGNLSGQVQGRLAGLHDRSGQAAEFYLWRSTADGELGSWKTPRGYGFYTQPLLSVAAFTGGEFRAGSQRELFPLHENEAAIYRVLHQVQPFSGWLHHGLLNVDANWLSQKGGSAWYVSGLLEKHDCRILRYYFLTHHYRSPVAFYPDEIATGKRSCRRLSAFVEELQPLSGELPVDLKRLQVQIDEALGEDFNTPRAIGLCHKLRSLMRADNSWPEVPGSGELKSYLQEILGGVLRVI